MSENSETQLGSLDLSYFREDRPREILIEHPRIVAVGRSDFEQQVELQEQLIEKMKQLGITPASYPRAADLGAGSAPFARKVLIPQGWKSENVTNFDIVIPEPNPLIGSKWMAVDLLNLSHALYGGWNIPATLQEQRGTYDVVGMTYAFAPIVESLESVGNFLLRKGGIVMQTGLGSQMLYQSGRRGKQCFH